MFSPSIKAKTAAYLLLKKEIEQKKAQQEQLKKELEPYLLEAETNARGSHVLAFDTPLEVNGQRYASLQKMRKESKVLNEDRVYDWLATRAQDDTLTKSQRDLLSGIFVEVEHVDQEALWEVFVHDLMTQEELDNLFDTTVVWAFSPVKE